MTKTLLRFTTIKLNVIITGEIKVNKKLGNENTVKRFVCKLLFTTVFILILLSYSAFVSSIASVRAAEPDINDKMMAILNNVVGLNTEDYVVNITSNPDREYRGLLQKDVDATLYSVPNYTWVMDVKAYFVNDNVRMIYISYPELPAEYPPADTTVEMAKGLLERYQNYTGVSFYGELASMLDDVDATNNITKSAGNIRLEVNNFENVIADYSWRYIDEKGIVARSKSVLLEYERGRLKGFSNDWHLYTIGGTPKISGEEATEIAIEASKNYSYEVSTENGTLTVTGFEIAPESLGHEVLSYLNNPNPSLARGGDPFTLYPSWYVPIGFRQSYPGGVTGMIVTVWADTGEVSVTNPMVVVIPEVLSCGLMLLLLMTTLVAIICKQKLAKTRI